MLFPDARFALSSSRANGATSLQNCRPSARRTDSPNSKSVSSASTIQLVDSSPGAAHVTSVVTQSTAGRMRHCSPSRSTSREYSGGPTQAGLLVGHQPTNAGSCPRKNESIYPGTGEGTVPFSSSRPRYLSSATRVAMAFGRTKLDLTQRKFLLRDSTASLSSCTPMPRWRMSARTSASTSCFGTRS